MSDGTAKWTDLVELVEIAQAKVSEQFQIALVPEVRIIKIDSTKYKIQNTK